MRTSIKSTLFACLLTVAVPMSAQAQAADPTDVKLVPRTVSLEVDDPDVHLKKAATDIVNEVVLTPPKFAELLGVSYRHLSQAVAQFNATNYGEAFLFLKGGNALRHHYYKNIRGRYGLQDQGIVQQCDALFKQSDIDYAVNTHWKSQPERLDSRDFWLRDPSSNNEYGYQILNSLITQGMDRLREELLLRRPHIVFNPSGQVVDGTHSIMRELNDNFARDRTASFLQKWADHLAAQIQWIGAIVPSAPIYLTQETNGKSTQPVILFDELTLSDDEEVLTKVRDIRNLAMPDKTILEGPTPQLLYAYQRNYHISSVYLTSNYSETWPSDPTIDPRNYTKFALHRLKLSLPFRVTLQPVTSASKPFKKLLAKSISDPTSSTAKMNVLVAGGELIDVGVDHPSAALLGHSVIRGEDLDVIQVQWDTDTVDVPVAGGNWLNRDLKEAIFDIVGMPWRKKKYEKRLGRFMCLNRPDIIATSALPGVNNYLRCLEGSSSIAECKQHFPAAELKEFPVIVDFFIGADQNRHSIQRVMERLPAIEKPQAVQFFRLLQSYLQ
jgi:hypothetical protein